MKLHITLPALYIAATAFVSQAVEPTFYAGHSVMSEGSWASITCPEAGATLVTDATLRSLGFSDPKRVRVYGTGAYPASDGLNAGMLDDMPQVPSVRTSKGIVFYAMGPDKWTATGDPLYPYEHTLNPYTDKIVYFLSDRDSVAGPEPVDMRDGATSSRVTAFRTRVLHEQELEHLGASGRTYVGEDFRATRGRNFKFSMPGRRGDKIALRIRFSTKVTNGSSILSATVNGISGLLPDLTIEGCQTENYAVLKTLADTLSVAGESLDLGLTYTLSGTLFNANLDYIELFYDRACELTDGEFRFHSLLSPGQTISVAGCDAGTRIWDLSSANGIPREVLFTLENGNALIPVGLKDNIDMVAFNPEKITRTATAGDRYTNQDLHGMEAPEMLIISSPAYAEGARVIADTHAEDDGLRCAIVDPVDIYNEFTGGNPDPTAFRKLLKMWRDRGTNVPYCLLMGKPSYDLKNKTRRGYTPLPIWQSPDGLNETSSFSNDDYIGMTDDCADNEFSIRRATINTAVGRIPCISSNQALSTAMKIRDHVLDADLGAWRNKVMLIADDGDSGTHLDQSQTNYNGYRSGYGRSYNYDRLYLDAYPLVNGASGSTYPQATKKMLANYNDGVAFTNYTGHSSDYGWGHEHLWEWRDIVSMTNPNKTVIYAATCRFCPWDEDGTSAGEELLLNTRGGVAALITASRTVYISQNGTLNSCFSKRLFERDDNDMTIPVAEALRRAKNDYSGDNNRLRYIFAGDPAMRLNNIRHRIVVDSINGVNVSSGINYAQAKGGSRITLSGRVTNTAGKLLRDFNGSLDIQLYDAETVIQTNGNNDSSAKRIYNDRKNRLAVAVADVRKGQWSASLVLPMEISNNYSPALVSVYASDKRRREANGSSERLYIYGYEEETVDSIGPVIEHFYLNRPDFKDGDVVNASPVVRARLTDASGINLSDAGVGHRITLRVDDNVPYSDVSTGFTADIDGCGGDIFYQIKDLAPGNHTLTLEAWDNLNNSTRSTISFRVSAQADPYILSLGTDCNPATSGVNFSVGVDRPETDIECNLQVMDLNGRVLWEFNSDGTSGRDATISAYWNLCDKNGRRVPRGIYLYRARVRTADGVWSTRTNKLAVTAQ